MINTIRVKTKIEIVIRMYLYFRIKSLTKDHLVKCLIYVKNLLFVNQRV